MIPQVPPFVCPFFFFFFFSLPFFLFSCQASPQAAVLMLGLGLGNDNTHEVEKKDNAARKMHKAENDRTCFDGSRDERDTQLTTLLHLG